MLLREVSLRGMLAEQLGGAATRHIEKALEGAPYDREVLAQVAKRAFQEAQVRLAGVFPDDLVRAVLAAQ
jgi:hypothetical protein